MTANRSHPFYLLASLAMSALIPFAAFLFVPSYKAMFSAFPQLWPSGTRLLFAYYPALLGVPLGTLLLWRLLLRSKQPGPWFLAASIVVTAVLLFAGFRVMAPSDLVLEAIRRGGA